MISYNIPVNSIVSLKIFDIIGREIKVLANESKPAGYYEVEFNGSEYSSGIYIYSLKALPVGKDKFYTETRKMLLTK